MRTIDQMIQSEVLCCMSHIVATMACGWEQCGDKDLNSMCEQAMELSSPIPDYEEAAMQAGFTVSKDHTGAFYWHNVGNRKDAGGQGYGSEERAYQACLEDNDLEPYDREVFEHWAVTDWFADKLIEAGEKVDKDFGNLCIWARTTTGQGIASDGVIERIYAATHQKDEA